MARSKYAPSLFQKDHTECYLCGTPKNLVRHEVIYGYGNREQSKKYGLWITVCPWCHAAIHGNFDEFFYLKRMAQALFENEHGHDKFMRIYGRNYLEWTD